MGVLTLVMLCPSCAGRWVALCTGTTIHGDRLSYHFHRESVQCPRCGAEGAVNGDTLMEYQRHPDVVATTLTGGSP